MYNDFAWRLRASKKSYNCALGSCAPNSNKLQAKSKAVFCLELYLAIPISFIIDLFVGSTETKYMKLKTKTQKNIVIFGISSKKLYCYFGFFWKNLTEIRVCMYMKTTTSEHFVYINCSELVILWVSSCKNKCFWKRFTCTYLIIRVRHSVFGFETMIWGVVYQTNTSIAKKNPPFLILFYI